MTKLHAKKCLFLSLSTLFLGSVWSGQWNRFPRNPTYIQRQWVLCSRTNNFSLGTSHCSCFYISLECHFRKSRVKAIVFHFQRQSLIRGVRNAVGIHGLDGRVMAYDKILPQSIR